MLPSSLWRISVCTFGVPLVDDLPPDASGDLPAWLPLGVYVVLLSLASEALAFTAVGLVARWGEVFPRWIPGLAGRRVPISFAAIPAALGATVLTLLSTWVAITAALGVNVQGEEPDVKLLTFDTWEGTLVVLTYSPLLAWGPLLAALTVAYVRRRTASPDHVTPRRPPTVAGGRDPPRRRGRRSARGHGAPAWRAPFRRAI